MPNQSKLITKVNNVLNQLPNIEFEFERGGVCGGLASLFIQYELMGKPTFRAKINDFYNYSVQ